MDRLNCEKCHDALRMPISKLQEASTCRVCKTTYVKVDGRWKISKGGQRGVS